MCVDGTRMLLPLDPQQMFGMYEGPRMLLSGTFVLFLLPARRERFQGQDQIVPNLMACLQKRQSHDNGK